MFQVPATHPKGVTASGHLNMVAEDGVPNIPFFQTDENIAVKVSLPGFFIQFEDCFYRRGSPMLVAAVLTIVPPAFVAVSSLLHLHKKTFTST